jgi:PAS domain S-box-containing protein
MQDQIRVLLIDDDPCQIELTKINIENVDNSILADVVLNPIDALEILHEHNYECIVSDFQMPGMNGIDLCKKIRSFSKIPFIIHTSRGSEEVASAAFAAGADDYIRKEVPLASYEVLARRVREVVFRRRFQNLYEASIEDNRGGFAIIQGLNFVYANKAMATMLGLEKPEDLIGKSILTWVHVMDKDLIKNRTLNRQRGEDEPRFYEYNVKREDGQIRTLEASVSLIDYMGKPASLIFNHDVTDRKNAEKALFETDDRLRKTQEMAHLGTWELDLVTNALYWSDEVYRIFGLKPQMFKATYEAFLEAVHPEDREMVDLAYTNSLHEGRNSYEIEHRVVRKSTGEVRYVYERCEHLRDQSNKVLRSIGMVQDITDRKLVEIERRESEEKYASLYSSMVEGVALHELIYDNHGKPIDYRIIDVNPAYTSITGLAKEGVIGKHASKLYGTGDPPYLNIYAEVASTGNTTKFGTFFPPMNKHFSISVFSMNKGRFATVFQDVTEQANTEHELRLKNERLARSEYSLSVTNEELKQTKDQLQEYLGKLERTIDDRTLEIKEVSGRLVDFMEAAPDAFFIYDKDLNLIELNKAALDLYPEETDKSSLIGKNIKEIAPGIEKTPRYNAFKKILETGEPFYEDVHRVISRFGDRWASTWAFKTGPNLGIIRRDITQLMTAEGKVREAIRYERSLLEASLDPLVTISPDGKIMDVNQATIEVTGVPRQELVGSDFTTYFTDQGKARAGYRRVFDEGVVRDYPLAIRHTSGKITDVLYNATVYRNDGGEVQGVFAAARDVTERHLLEKKLRYAEQLSVMSRMGAMVAHDLRGPLNIIMQAVNMAKRDASLTPKMLEMVEKNASRSLMMINDWRNNTTDVVTAPSRIDLGNIVRKVIDETTIPEDVKLCLDISEGSFINADPNIIQRVVDNLLRNAVEAMPDGGRLSVSVHNDDRKVFLEISDTGVGIPEESRENVFWPLYTTKVGGLGLGLSFCRKAVEAYGGTINFESKLGEGTTFIIEFKKMV